MAMKYARLTEPLVRDDGVLRPATWDEALDRAAEGFAADDRAPRAGRARHLQLLEGHQRGELPGAEARAGRVRHQQHRLAATEPDTLLASSVWRRCSVRVAARAPTGKWRRPTSIFLWGSNARETHPIFFHHVLKGDAQRGAALRRRPAPHAVGPVGRRVAGPRRRQRHRARQRDGARDHPRRPREPRRSSTRATTGFEAYRATRRALHARVRRARRPASRPT